MLRRMINTEEDFYKYMGRIFGSREIQRKTSDRFYDDDTKQWILDIIGNEVISVVSIKNSEIKNVYAKDAFSLMEILKSVYKEVKKGVVPEVYREIYTGAGYEIIKEEKNFITIVGGMNNER